MKFKTTFQPGKKQPNEYSSAMFSEPPCADQNIQCASPKMNTADTYNDGLNSTVIQYFDCSIDLAKFLLKNTDSKC